jgi:hypothetical protein
MSPELLTAVHLCGILAIVGSFLYALGDVLLLAPKVGAVRQAPTLQLDVQAYPELRRRVDLLAGLAALPQWRLEWGGLLGVFAAPLMLAGIWLVYQGLRPARMWLALPPVLLFAYATVIGPFIHGSFIFLGESVQALDAVGTDGRTPLMGILSRLHRVMQIGYGVLFLCVIVASIWFSVAVASGRTLFPLWMAGVNPVLATLAWLVIKRFLPRRVVDYTEGAGFNIAFLIFFGLTTATLW